MKIMRAIGLVAACLVLVGPTAHSSARSPSASACANNPAYPAPNEARQLFYLQRTGNANTVVYVAKLDRHGKLDADEPLEVYWRRFANKGEKLELGVLERRLAFGVQYEPADGHPGKYLSNLVSYPRRKALLEQTADGSTRAIMRIAEEDAQLVCIYVEWRPLVGIIPQVLYVDLLGRSLNGKKTIRERIHP